MLVRYYLKLINDGDIERNNGNKNDNDYCLIVRKNSLNFNNSARHLSRTVI